MFYDGASAVESVELKRPYLAHKKLNRITDARFTKKSGEIEPLSSVYLSKRKYNPVTP